MKVRGGTVVRVLFLGRLRRVPQTTDVFKALLPKHRPCNTPECHSLISHCRAGWSG
jgi:hypothetical protein